MKDFFTPVSGELSAHSFEFIRDAMHKRERRVLFYMVTHGAICKWSRPGEERMHFDVFLMKSAQTRAAVYTVPSTAEQN